MNKIILLMVVFYCCIFTSNSKVCRGNYTLVQENWSQEALRVRTCNIIEGALTIQLLDLKNFSLPNLTMVTDYILIYRIKGKQILANLLPNLKVIRGRKLFYGFALIAVANDDLEQIGKFNLIILNGSVAFEDNIMLCPGGPTIWQKRTSPNANNRFINNHPYCFEDCLAEAEHSDADYSETKGRTPKDEDCDKECIGGCSIPKHASRCSHCRHFVKNGNCIPNCSEDDLQHMEYNCITADECRKLNSFVYRREDQSVGSCVSQCPRGYEADPISPLSCIKQKEGAGCKTSKITSVEMGESLKDCTIIRGNLKIELYDRANITQIRQYTKNIVIVTEYMEMIGDREQYSMNYLFPNLAEIRGEKTVDHGGRRYALYVADNINLRELWNFPSKNLTVSGNAYVAFNPKLCPTEVDQLSIYIKSPFKVYRAGNGMKAQCMITVTELVATPGSTEGTVHLNFEHTYDSVDDRWYLGYFIYYKESKDNLMSVYDGRVPYSDEKLWTRKIFIFTKVPHKMQYYYTVNGLKPNCRYAFYLESFGLGSERRALQSEIVYVTTFDKNPGKIKRTDVTFEDNNSITIVINSEEANEFYELNVSVQINEGQSDLTKESLPAIDQLYSEKKREPQLSSANDYFTYLPDMKEITCDGDIDIEKLMTIYKRNIQVENDIINRLLYDTTEECEEDHPIMNLSNAAMKWTNDEKDDNRTINSKKDNIAINWTTNEISFNLIKENKWSAKQSSIGTVWNMSKMIDKTKFNLILPFNYANYNDLDYIFSIRACRNRKEDCSDLLKRNEPCAQCSPTYNWREYYDATDNFNVMAKIYSVNETETLTRNVNHQCANLSGGRQNLEIRWQEDRMALGYFISVMNGKNELSNIWINKKTASDLDNTCYLETEYTNFDVSVNSRRRIRSLRLGGVSIVNSEDYSNSYIWETIAWSFASLVLVIVGIVALMWKLKNANKITVWHKNVNFSDQDSLLEKVQSYLIDGDISLTKIELGKGNFAIVYKGEFSGREVAVKQIIEKSSSNDDNLTPQQRLCKANLKAFKEMDMCMKMDNMLIVKCYGMIINEKRFFQVYEYIPGGNLENYLKESNGISVEDKKRIAFEIAKAIKYLAEAKIVHLDIASRNILINGKSIKICDFGLAVHWPEDCNCEVSEIFPACSAPERLNSKLYLNTDVWSLGPLFYEIIKGEKLFKDLEAGRIRDIIRARFSDDEETSEKDVNADSVFERIYHLPDEYSQGIFPNVLESCLKKHSDRPSADEIVKKLEIGQDDSNGKAESINEVDISQNGNGHAEDNLQNSFFIDDDEEAPCLTPDDVSGSTPCISLSFITRKSGY